MPNKNIIIIGHKSAGKSIIGKYLARTMKRKYYDLDKEIENIYKQKNATLDCRGIYSARGEIFFRSLESKSLKNALKKSNIILSAGGGTFIHMQNRKILSGHVVIHLKRNKKVLFNETKKNGWPAYFPKDTNPKFYFDKTWEERNNIYDAISDFSILNNNEINNVVQKIINKLNKT